jgi:hypothetical protein
VFGIVDDHIIGLVRKELDSWCAQETGCLVYKGYGDAVGWRDTALSAQSTKEFRLKPSKMIEIGGHAAETADLVEGETNHQPHRVVRAIIGTQQTVNELRRLDGDRQSLLPSGESIDQRGRIPSAADF